MMTYDKYEQTVSSKNYTYLIAHVTTEQAYEWVKTGEWNMIMFSAWVVSIIKEAEDNVVDCQGQEN